MKKIFVIILTLLIFVVIFYIMTYLESLKKDDSVAQDAPKKSYLVSPQDKLLKTVEARPTLAPNDLIAKKKLLDKLKNKDSVVLKNDDFSIEYTKSADSFMAEIKNKDVETTKRKILSFFTEKGLSNEGMCSLPLVFYLNSEIAKDYSLNSKTFSSIPDFCK